MGALRVRPRPGWQGEVKEGIQYPSKNINHPSHLIIFSSEYFSQRHLFISKIDISIAFVALAAVVFAAPSSDANVETGRHEECLAVCGRASTYCYQTDVPSAADLQGPVIA